MRKGFCPIHKYLVAVELYVLSKLWKDYKKGSNAFLSFVFLFCMACVSVSIPSFFLFHFISLLSIKFYFQHLPVLLMEWCLNVFNEIQAFIYRDWLRQDCTTCSFISDVLCELVYHLCTCQVYNVYFVDLSKIK